MGFRIAASIMQEIGEENSKGQIMPFLFVCDEMKEITKNFPADSGFNRQHQPYRAQRRRGDATYGTSLRAFFRLGRPAESHRH
jgi:hypothetical protein